MTLKSKNYLIFQVTIPIVTFIVMLISHIIHPLSYVLENEILKAAAIHSIYPSIIFSIASAISWKIWKGKNWYSLSLILLVALFVISALIVLLSFIIIDNYIGFIIFLFNLDLLVYFPASLLVLIIIGFIGQWCNRISHG
mgnify:FL=1